MRIHQLKPCFLGISLALLSYVAAAYGDDPTDTPAASRRQGERILQAFNYDGVTLLPSMHRSQLEQVREYYMRLRPNDVLRGFRLKHKDWAPGKDLGGAYSERPLSFGQWLGGFARIYRATGDTAVRDRALYLMNECGQTISEDGAYGYRDQKRSHYGYDKMVGGLVDVYEYLDSTDALTYLEKVTEWAEKNLDRSNEYALPSEWYTLSENLYRAYELTGNERYRKFARSGNTPIFGRRWAKVAMCSALWKKPKNIPVTTPTATSIL